MQPEYYCVISKPMSCAVSGPLHLMWNIPRDTFEKIMEMCNREGEPLYV